MPKNATGSRERRWKAADDLRNIQQRIYASEPVTFGQLNRVLRDNYKTILRALEYDRRVLSSRGAHSVGCCG
jgi:hypothetical protein